MDAIKTLSQHKDPIKQKFGVEKIGIFGSFARGEETKNSDIDILVEFMEGQKTFDNYMDLLFFLENLFGKKVDLITIVGLHKYIRSYVEKEIIWCEN